MHSGFLLLSFSLHLSCMSISHTLHHRRPLPRLSSPLPPGHRHPFLAKYKVGFSSSGQVLAIDLDLYHNAGNSWDLSHSIMDRALGHSDCCYKIPNVRVKGNMCYTHMSSNTAFRGFGGPQVRRPWGAGWKAGLAGKAVLWICVQGGGRDEGWIRLAVHEGQASHTTMHLLTYAHHS